MESVGDIGKLPALDGDAIHVWGVHVPAVLERIDALHALLCDAERSKAARFVRDADRYASIAARGALRVLLAGYTGMPAKRIEFVYSETGKPSLAGTDVAFNVSHSAEWVVVAVGRGRAVGVDIEQIRHGSGVLDIAGRYYSDEERAQVETADDPHRMFFRIWSRKEAYIKARGSALFDELQRISVPIDDGAEWKGWYFYGLEADPQYAASVVTDKPAGTIACYDFGSLSGGFAP